MSDAKTVTVREMVKEWLEQHGYDGLCTDGCGCSTDDSAACTGGCLPELCGPAYAWEVPREGSPLDGGGGGFNIWYSLEKPDGAIGRVGACWVCKGKGRLDTHSMVPPFVVTCNKCGGTGKTKGGGAQ